MKKSFLLFLFVLCLSACHAEIETAEQQELRETLLELTQLAGDAYVDHTEIDQAIHEASSLGLEDKERDWFVRSYLLYISANKEIDRDEVYEDSQLRMRYEQAWQDVAFEKYGVHVEEDRLHEVIELNLASVEETLDADSAFQGSDLVYLAEALGYRLDEFFYTFERHVYERWVISESLYPLLQDDYGVEDFNEVSRQYRLEVIDSIVESQA